MVKIGRKAVTLAGHMAPANLESGTLLRLVRRALDEVSPSPEQRDGILHQALVDAGVHDVPTDFRDFAGFLFGPLRDATAAQLGADDAQMVVDSLESAVGARMSLQIELDEEQEEPEADSAPLLVVDDDIKIRSQLVQVLRQRGYNAVSAPDSNVALAMCVRYRPKLVIAALVPEAHRGKQLSALMRVAFGSEAPPLVLLVPSGAGDIPLTDAAAVLAKPVSDEALLAAVEPLVGKAG